MSRESASGRSCIKPWQHEKYESYSLSFTNIGIHCEAFCCHLASQQQCRSSKRHSRLWMALTLYCSCPQASFSFTDVWTICCGQSLHISLSVRQMQSNWATVRRMSSCRGTCTGFQIERFQCQCQIFVSRVCVYAVMSVSIFMRHSEGAYCLLLWSVCVGLDVPGPGWGVSGDSDELRHV